MLHGAITSAEARLTKAMSNPLDKCRNPSLDCAVWLLGKKLLVIDHLLQEQTAQLLKKNASVLVFV